MNYKKYFAQRSFEYQLSAPFIYGMIFPIAFLDFSLFFYKNICFRLYGLPLVSRSKYVRIDRHKLKYLTFIEKVNCVYCGYANGVFAYAVKLAGDTEKFWCGIKHRKDVLREFEEPAHHKDFLEYGDEKGYRELDKMAQE